MKKAIAMRCTEQQFYAILPKLNNIVKSIEDFEYCPYLINNYGNKRNHITNIRENYQSSNGREVFESWNEQIFLQACGIEIEPTYSLTKEQLCSLTDPKIKEWFPEVFENKTGWYKHSNGRFKNWIIFIDYEKEICFGHGTDYWTEPVFKNMKEYISGSCTEATEVEVFEALKKEAVKRGFVNGAYYQHDVKIERRISGNEYVYLQKENQLRINGFCLFDNGKWIAEIIPTITKAEAEKQLNKKIVD